MSRELPKLYVVGSIPIARSNKINHLDVFRHLVMSATQLGAIDMTIQGIMTFEVGAGSASSLRTRAPTPIPRPPAPVRNSLISW